MESLDDKRSNIVKRRLFKELIDSTINNHINMKYNHLNNHLNNCIVESIKYTEDNNIIVCIKDEFYKERNNYEFVLNLFYPFHPPIVKIDNIAYTDFLIESNKKQLKELANINCFCCNTCTYSKNWLGTMTISYIIKEMKYYREIRKLFIIKLLCKKISDKYLNSDIDFFKWGF